jgi:hypothetical protein
MRNLLIISLAATLPVRLRRGERAPRQLDENDDAIHDSAPLAKTLGIWIFWLLASIAIGGITGAWFWLAGRDFEAIFSGMIVSGFIFTCLSMWRDW